MASTDAFWPPRKNVAFRITFPIYDAEGDLVTGATGLDSEISKDGGTFADVTAEATEIATASGMYFLDLTNTEMNADTVAIIVKTTSSGAKTTVLIMYPQESGDQKVDVVQWLGSAPNALVSGRIDSIPGAMAAGVITAAAIATDAIDGDAIATSAVTDIQSGLATAAAVATIDARLDTEIPAILAAVDTETGVILAAVDTEVGVLVTNVAAILAATDTEIGAIKTVTDQLVAAGVDPTGVPAATDTPLKQLQRIHQALTNQVTVTATTKTFHNAAGVALWAKALSDNGTTFTEAKGA